MENDIQQILLTQEQIQNRIRELGQVLTAEYADKNPVIIGVLKGVVVFYADMIRQIKVPCQLDFMWLSSYSGTNTTGKMLVRQDVTADIKGRHVLILEDIYDTGTSLDFTVRHLAEKEPASIKICTLLDKPSHREVPQEAKYVGFTIPDCYAVGYGMDEDERYRYLPYIGVLRQSDN